MGLGLGVAGVGCGGSGELSLERGGEPGEWLESGGAVEVKSADANQEVAYRLEDFPVVNTSQLRITCHQTGTASAPEGDGRLLVQSASLKPLDVQAPVSLQVRATPEGRLEISRDVNVPQPAQGEPPRWLQLSLQLQSKSERYALPTGEVEVGDCAYDIRQDFWIPDADPFRVTYENLITHDLVMNAWRETRSSSGYMGIDADTDVVNVDGKPQVVFFVHRMVPGIPVSRAGWLWPWRASGDLKLSPVLDTVGKQPVDGLFRVTGAATSGGTLRFTFRGLKGRQADGTPIYEELTTYRSVDAGDGPGAARVEATDDAAVQKLVALAKKWNQVLTQDAAGNTYQFIVFADGERGRTGEAMLRFTNATMFPGN